MDERSRCKAAAVNLDFKVNLWRGKSESDSFSAPGGLLILRRGAGMSVDRNQVHLTDSQEPKHQ